MASREIVTVEGMPMSGSPLSLATTWGNLVYTSGQVATDTSKDAEGQTREIMEKLGKILEAAGSGWEHVLKATCFITDVNDFQAFNAVYREFVGEDKPARSTVVVQLVAPQYKVEVEVVAGIPGK